jgi:hypothetical protein
VNLPESVELDLYCPFSPFQGIKYGEMEEALLSNTFKTLALNVEGQMKAAGGLAEVLSALVSQLPVVHEQAVFECQDSMERCVRFTKGQALPALLNAINRSINLLAALLKKVIKLLSLDDKVGDKVGIYMYVYKYICIYIYIIFFNCRVLVHHFQGGRELEGNQKMEISLRTRRERGRGTRGWIGYVHYVFIYIYEGETAKIDVLFLYAYTLFSHAQRIFNSSFRLLQLINALPSIAHKVLDHLSGLQTSIEERYVGKTVLIRGLCALLMIDH